MCQSHLPHPRIAIAAKDIINNLIGEVIHEPVWWNMHRDIMSLQIVGCNDKMALGLISFLKHQIRASFSTNLPQLDAKMRCTFMDTHSQWADRFFGLREPNYGPTADPFLSSDTYVSQQSTSWALLVQKANCMFRHEENLCLFVNHFWGRVYTMHAWHFACSTWHVHLIHSIHCATPWLKTCLHTAAKRCSLPPRWPQVF